MEKLRNIIQNYIEIRLISKKGINLVLILEFKINPQFIPDLIPINRLEILEIN